MNAPVCKECGRPVGRRSTEQNARLWKLLRIVSARVDWHGARLSPEDWKVVFTAAHRRQRAVPNLDGDGFVVLGEHTSSMTAQEHSDLQLLIEAFCAQRGIEIGEG